MRMNIKTILKHLNMRMNIKTILKHLNMRMNIKTILICGWFCPWREKHRKPWQIWSFSVSSEFCLLSHELTLQLFSRHLSRHFSLTSWCVYRIFSMSSLPRTAWIRVDYSSLGPKAPWYPLQILVQCVSKLTERDVFYQTQNHMMKFGLYPLWPPEYRQGYGMKTALYSRSKMICSSCTLSHRARFPRLIRS